MSKQITFKFGNMNSVAKDETMTKFNSIEELVDNAIDAGANEVDINIGINGNTGIVIKSHETNNNIDFDNIEENLFSYTDGSLVSKFKYENGSGRYGVGFKAACVGLIPDTEDGNIIIESIAKNGNTVHAGWSLKINDNKTSKDDFGEIDTNLVYLTDDYYNFFIKIDNIVSFDEKDLQSLKTQLGIRYREKITNDNVIIKVNNDTVRGYDRLYLNEDENIELHCEKLMYCKDGKLVKIGELTWTNVEPLSHLPKAKQQTRLIPEYDISFNSHSSDNKRGSKKGAIYNNVKCTGRAGFEIGCNGIIFSYPNGDFGSSKIFKVLTGVELQPIHSTFRARLMITDNEFANNFFIGARNKCLPTINSKWLMEDEGCRDIRVKLFGVPGDSKHISLINRFLGTKPDKDTNVSDTQNKGILKYNKKFEDDFKEKNNIRIEFDYREKNYSAFSTNKDNIEVINLNHELFNGFKLNDTLYVIIKDIIGEAKSVSSVHKNLEAFRNRVENIKFNN